ncbi:8888_t:CDS:2 [Paraglomus brasilianum]|uniref:8888_t:CDS:1 n=1 Tax=Paraglomus brasilianum TaxID=144538 RepID=A0A9N9AKL5_9GLOM|nr:8888_t:CDS:2 [Paraglomus brasilianum]
MAFNQGNNNSTTRPTFGFGQNPGGFSFGSSTNAASPSFGGAMQNNNSILSFGSASQSATPLTFGASQTTAATSPFATAITSSAGTSPFAAAQSPQTFSGFGGLGFGGPSQAASTRPSFGGINASTTSAPASTGLGFGFGGLSQASSTKPLFGGTANTTTTTSTSAPSGLGLGFGVPTPTKPLFASTKSPLGGAVNTANTTNSTGLGFGFGGLSQAASPKPFLGGMSQASSTKPSLGSNFFARSTTPQTTTSTSATTSRLPKPISTPATTSGSAPTIPNWLKTASIEDIMNKWNKDLDVCEKGFHSQAKEIGEMDRKVIDNIGKVGEIANQVESIKSIQQVIRSDLDNIAEQSGYLEKIVEQYETKYANITAETAVDKTREKSYKLVESMNEDLDKMGQTLATIITEVNRNMSTSNAVALGDETDISAQNEEEDALDEVVKILNAHLTSLQWIDQTATKLSEQFKATKIALRDAQGNGNGVS